MSKKPKSTAADMTTLLGGVELTVAYLPPGVFDQFDEPIRKRLEKFQPLLGTTEKVKVRQVLLHQMVAYGNATAFHDEAAQIEIYCGKGPGWANFLTRESVNDIADKGLELNLDFFSAWYQRQAKWKEVQQPEAIVKLRKDLAELQKVVNQSLSPNSSSSTSATTG